MKLLQIAFIAVFGVICLATYATSDRLRASQVSEQGVHPAPVTS